MSSIRTSLTALAFLLALGSLGLTGCAPEPVGAKPAAPQQATARGISDVPMPSGAEQDVEDSLVLGSLDRWTGQLVLSSSLSPANAFAFYRDRMPNFGWEPLASIQTDVSVLSFARAERVATIQIERRDFIFGGSRIAITMAPRQGESATSRPPNDGVEVTPLQ